MSWWCVTRVGSWLVDNDFLAGRDCPSWRATPAKGFRGGRAA